MSENNFSYDKLPYQNNTMYYLRPEHLETVATILGLTPPVSSKARILELGCGYGLNSIAFAQRNPDSYSLAIDMSETQIAGGKVYIDHLKLKNIDLKAMSIMDIDQSHGKFDYIICHGVFSWVPKEVQDKILDIIGTMLNPNGVGYISYNALPGWHIAQTFRDILQYHIEIFETDEEKISQAIALLSFMQDTLKDSTTPYAELLKAESQMIKSNTASYIKHEYLDKGNTQFYLTDFANMISQNGLQYLGDSFISTMYVGNLPPKTAERLKEVPNIILQEQYIDFISNRRFRNSLVCKSDLMIRRNIDPIIMRKLYSNLNIDCTQNIDAIDLNNNTDSVTFNIIKNGSTVNVVNAGMKAVFVYYMQNRGRYIPFDELVQYALKYLPNSNAEQVSIELSNSLLHLFISGLLDVSIVPIHTVSDISTKPKTSDLVRFEASTGFNNNIYTNQIGHSVLLSPLERVIILYTDGAHSQEMILDKIKEHIKSGEISMELDSKKLDLNNMQPGILEKCLHTGLVNLRNNFFLIG